MSNLRPERESTDVVVIGCGAGGGVVAKELSEAGLAVVVIETGRRYVPEEDYRSDRRDFPNEAWKVFEPKDHRRDLYTSGPLGFKYSTVKAVGGSTVVSWGVFPRFHESDFRVRTSDGVAEDWPITYKDLEPYYALVDDELGVSGPSPQAANPYDAPRSRPFPTPPHPISEAGRIIALGARKLGLHPFVPPLNIPTVEWNGRPACIRAGACGYGCRISAKSSVDVTYVRKAENTGRVQIRPSSTAREITVDSTGKARSVVYFDSQGREQEIAARAFVVAGNAIETPRLLLMSKSGIFPEGLANSSGLVGRYLTEHLDAGCRAKFPQPLENWRGVPVSTMIQDDYETKNTRNFTRGWLVEVATTGNWPVAAGRRIGGWGTAHKARMKDLYGHELEIFAQGEQLPDIRNAVTLDPDVKDHLGLPVPHLVSEPRGEDLNRLTAMEGNLRDLLDAAGAAEILASWSHKAGGSGHYMGTCRMGRDPQQSVVSASCRAHDVSNLFVADSSVFVTGASAHPMSTIMALAARTAYGMVAAFKRGEL